MKHLFRILTAVVLVLSAQALRATNSVTVSPLEGDADTEVEVSVVLENTVEATALQVLIDMSAAAECQVVSASAEAVGRAAGFSASAGVRDGRISAMLYSLSRLAIAPGSGEVLRFKVRLCDKPMDTTLPVTAQLTDASAEEIDCSGTPVALRIVRPVLEISRGSIDFGRVLLTDKATQTVTLRNTGTGPLSILGVQFDRPEFAVYGTIPTTVQPGTSQTLTIEFAPDERGYIETVAHIDCNSSGTLNLVEITATPYAKNELTIGAVSGVSDSEVTIPILMDNMDPVNGISLELRLPEALKYVDGSFALNAVRAGNHTFSVSESNGVVKIMVYSLTNTPFSGNEGEVASLRVRLDGRGMYLVSPDKVVLSAYYHGEATNVLSDACSAYVSISYPSIQVVSSVSLGRTAVPEAAEAELTIRNHGSAPLTVNRMDIDTDLLTVDAELPLTVQSLASATVKIRCTGEATGNIDGTIRIYSNDPAARLRTIEVTAVRYAEHELAFSAADTPVSDAEAVVDVALSNYNAVRALQFDVTYPPERLAATDAVECVGRAEGFQVSRRETGDGVARYFVYSLSGKEIEPGTGSVLKIPFALLEGCSVEALQLNASEFIISSPTMENANSLTTSVPFAVNIVEPPLLKGDVDKNGTVSISDITHVIDIHLQKIDIEDKLPIIDLNEDGDFSLTDITAIIQILINKQ